MGRYEQVCQELSALRESIRQAERAGAQRQDLYNQCLTSRRRKEELAQALAKEEADVAALEHLSLASLVQTVLGRREERLDQEEREAVAARLRYQEACRTLADVEARLAQAEQAQRAAQADRARYDALLKEKQALLKERDPELARRLVPLEERAARCRSLLREIAEAQSAGRRAREALDRVAQALDSAEGWGAWDMLGGGLIATMAKHSRIDDARQAASEAQDLLSRFHNELADVQVCAQIRIDIGELETFCDFFFDGLIVDWVVQSQIQDAQESVAEPQRQLAAAMEQLDRMESQTTAELARTESELRTLIEDT